jgi:hypothetical protein
LTRLRSTIPAQSAAVGGIDIMSHVVAMRIVRLDTLSISNKKRRIARLRARKRCENCPYNVDLPPNEQAQRCGECQRRRALNRLPRCALCRTDLGGAQPVFRVERSRFQSWRTKLNKFGRKVNRDANATSNVRQIVAVGGEPWRSLGVLLPQVGNAARAARSRNKLSTFVCLFARCSYFCSFADGMPLD